MRLVDVSAEVDETGVRVVEQVPHDEGPLNGRDRERHNPANHGVDVKAALVAAGPRSPLQVEARRVGERTSLVLEQLTHCRARWLVGVVGGDQTACVS
jgi:hypothetical protein